MPDERPDPAKTVPFIPPPVRPRDAEPSAADGSVWDLVAGIRPLPQDGMPSCKENDFAPPPLESPYGRRYRLCGTVGKGGLGTVHLGLDRRIGREVAIKEIIASPDHADARVLARFLREARITGQLEHPGIVPVYDIGVNDKGAPYYIMRYVRGRTLHDRLGEGRCLSNSPAGMAARLQLLDNLIAVCETMAYAHSHNIIHRDLKPANIVIGEFGETIILDWGLAKSLDEKDDRAELTPSVFQMPAELREAADQCTLDSEIMGTPGYMAPEQVTSRWGNIDRQTDVYALGSILHTLLTGQVPYTGTVMDIIDRLENDDPTPAFDGLSFDVPPELRAICERALTKDRDVRFKDAGELAQELRAYRDGRVVSVYAYSRVEIFTRFVMRHTVTCAAGLVAAAAIFVGAGLAVNFGLDADRARERAVVALGRARGAMADVTRLSDETTRAGNKATHSLTLALATLRADMFAAFADSPGNGDGNEDAAGKRLEALWLRHPEVEDFFLADNTGTITRMAGNRARDVAELALKAVPATGAEGRLAGTLALADGRVFTCLILPAGDGPAEDAARVGAVLHLDTWMKETLKPLAERFPDVDVFCLNGDGLNLSDPSEKEVGRNIFTDPLYEPYPELRAFVRRMQDNDAGVGYYSFRTPSETTRQYRIAAWQTLAPDPEVTWKVAAMRRYVPDNPEDLDIAEASPSNHTVQ